MNYLELDRGLNGDYKDAYQRVCTYATMKGYTDELIEEQMNELYDILLSDDDIAVMADRLINSVKNLKISLDNTTLALIEYK